MGVALTLPPPEKKIKVSSEKKKLNLFLSQINPKSFMKVIVFMLKPLHITSQKF